MEADHPEVGEEAEVEDRQEVVVVVEEAVVAGTSMNVMGGVVDLSECDVSQYIIRGSS